MLPCLLKIVTVLCMSSWSSLNLSIMLMVTYWVLVLFVLLFRWVLISCCYYSVTDLSKLGGLKVVAGELTHSDSDVRKLAAWVLGKASQNNPFVQAQVCFLPPLKSRSHLKQSRFLIVWILVTGSWTWGFDNIDKDGKLQLYWRSCESTLCCLCLDTEQRSWPGYVLCITWIYYASGEHTCSCIILWIR